MVGLDLTSSSSSASSEGQAIWAPEDDDLLPWPSLPVELLQTSILPKLPLSSLLAFRCVCRAWHSLLSSPAFWQHQWLPLHRPPLFALLLASPPSKLLRRWRKSCSIKFLPPPAQQPLLTSHPAPWRLFPSNFLHSFAPLRILSSSSGLLLIASAHHLLLCNPITKDFSQLPPLPAGIFPSLLDKNLVAMMVHSDRRGYSIFLATHSVNYIYESASRQWKKAAILKESSVRMGASMSDDMLGKFVPDSSGRSDSLIVIYDRRDERFTEMLTLWPERVVLPEGRQIWASSQGLTTIALLHENVGIWKLHGQFWSLTTVLPSEAAHLILRSVGKQFDCIKLGDLLCFFTASTDRIFIYHMVDLTGEWSCRCPYSKDFIQMFAFEPRPDVQV